MHARLFGTLEFPKRKSIGCHRCPHKHVYYTRKTIPCSTPSNVLPFYVTAETRFAECPCFASLSTLFTLSLRQCCQKVSISKHNALCPSKHFNYKAPVPPYTQRAKILVAMDAHVCKF